jgi:hypothetical protein
MVDNDPASDAAIHAFDQAIDRAEAARMDLDTELRGLRMARERRIRELGWTPMRSVSVTPFDGMTSVPAEVAEWRSLSRTAAVLRALEEADSRSMHRKQLTDKLTAMGRKGETIAAVSAALAYLARNDRVTALGQGWWQLGGPYATFSQRAPDFGARMTGDVKSRIDPLKITFAPNPEGSGMGPY